MDEHSNNEGADIMSDKALVILSTGEKDKAITGLLWATNALKNRWMEDVKVLFFGPFESLLAEDEEVQKWASQLFEYQTPTACKFISDSNQVSEKLTSLGVQIEYVGQMVADYIKEGYAPMVF